MLRRPPRPTRTDTLFPYTTLFLSAARHVAGAIKPVTVLGELLPAFHEPIGAQVRIGPHLGLLRHRIHYRAAAPRSEEHTSELQSLMRISYAVFCLKKKKIKTDITDICTYIFIKHTHY